MSVIESGWNESPVKLGFPKDPSSTVDEFTKTPKIPSR